MTAKPPLPATVAHPSPAHCESPMSELVRCPHFTLEQQDGWEHVDFIHWASAERTGPAVGKGTLAIRSLPLGKPPTRCPLEELRGGLRCPASRACGPAHENAPQRLRCPQGAGTPSLGDPPQEEGADLGAPPPRREVRGAGRGAARRRGNPGGQAGPESVRGSHRPVPGLPPL